MDNIPIICDLCSKDWTFSEQTGGLVVAGWGICPDCEPRMRRTIKKTHEEHTIDFGCPSHLSYANFIRIVRKGNLDRLVIKD